MNELNTPSYCRKKTNFVSSRKQFHVPPDYNFLCCLNAKTISQAFRHGITNGKRKEKLFRQI